MISHLKKKILKKKKKKKKKKKSENTAKHQHKTSKLTGTRVRSAGSRVWSALAARDGVEPLSTKANNKTHTHTHTKTSHLYANMNQQLALVRIDYFLERGYGAMVNYACIY